METSTRSYSGPTTNYNSWPKLHRWPKSKRHRLGIWVRPTTTNDMCRTGTEIKHCSGTYKSRVHWKSLRLLETISQASRVKTARRSLEALAAGGVQADGTRSETKTQLLGEVCILGYFSQISCRLAPSEQHDSTHRDRYRPYRNTQDCFLSQNGVQP